MTNHMNEFSKLFDGEQRYAGEPRPVADARPAPAPVRISPEVRETILEGLRRFRGDDLERAIHAFGHEPKGANAAYIDRLKASRAKIESAIAFVEALPWSAERIGLAPVMLGPLTQGVTNGK